MGSVIKNNKGIALITALIISLIMLIFATGVLYFIFQSTHLSSIGKAYETEREAVDGAIEVTKDNIINVLIGEPVNPGITDPGGCFSNMATEMAGECIITFPLPGTNWFQNFTATVRFERLDAAYIPGSRIEFARAGGGLQSRGVLFRINAVVRGPKNTVAEATALYRFVM